MAETPRLGLVYTEPATTPSGGRYIGERRYRLIVGVDESTVPPTFSSAGFMDPTPPDAFVFDPATTQLSYQAGSGHPPADIGDTFGTLTLSQAQQALNNFIDTQGQGLQRIRGVLTQDLADGWVVKQ